MTEQTIEQIDAEIAALRAQIKSKKRIRAALVTLADELAAAGIVEQESKDNVG